MYTQECVERAALEGRTVRDLGAGDAAGRVCVHTHLYIIIMNVMYVYMGLVMLARIHALAQTSIYLSVFTIHVCDESI